MPLDRADAVRDSRELAACWWNGDSVGFIDARALPGRLQRAVARDTAAIVDALAAGGVRGAGSIDLFAAFGIALAHEREGGDASAIARIRAAAVDAGGAGTAIECVSSTAAGAAAAVVERVYRERHAVEAAIAAHAQPLLPVGSIVLTHGPTGALSTGGAGTALTAIASAHAAGKQLHVFVTEGRPQLSGARSGVVELAFRGVAPTLVTDAAAAWIVRSAGVGAVLVGAAAIAANGDIVGEIGTCGIALAAAHSGVPLYVTAARTTIESASRSADRSRLVDGRGDELLTFGGLPVAPPDVTAANPRFDITPGHLVSAIVTEYGIARPPYEQSLADVLTRPDFTALLAL